MQHESQYHLDYRNASLLSKIYFGFATKVIRSIKQNGNRLSNSILLDQSLTDNDTLLLTESFSAFYEGRMSKISKDKVSDEALFNESYAGVKAGIVHALKWPFAKVCVLSLLGDLLTLFYSYFIKYIIDFIEDDTAETSQGIWMAIVFILSVYISSVIKNQFFFFSQKEAYNFRKIINSILFEKVSRMSVESLNENDSGKMITIISSDLLSIEKLFGFMGSILTVPITNLVVYGILIHDVGYNAALITFGFFVLQIILSLSSQKKVIDIKMSQAHFGDQLNNLVSDLAIGSRTLKCYAWEPHYIQKISTTRQQQQSKLSKLNFFSTLSAAFVQYLGLPATFCILSIIWAQEGDLSNAKVISIFSMVFNLFSSQNGQFYIGVLALIQFKAVAMRVARTMVMGERKQSEEPRVAEEDDKKTHPHIKLHNVESTWKSKVENNARCDTDRNLMVRPEIGQQFSGLKDIKVEMHGQGLTTVIGKVGSGKSTLLATIMKETIILKGEVSVHGNIAYVEQEPFIITGTVQENILFGTEHNEELFQEAIKYSQLSRDLAIMPRREKTLIGEKGLNLSGGQKARISLARALYSQADLYLLDDPLSAVDPHVAHAIFYECIKGYLSQKVVVLATHQIQFLKDSQSILVLDAGQQVIAGSYQEILSQGYNLDEILETFNQGGRRAAAAGDTTIEAQFQTMEINERSLVKGKGTVAGEEGPENVVVKVEEMPEQVVEMGEQEDLTSVTLSSYWTFFSQTCGIFSVILLITSYLLVAVLLLTPTYIISQWTTLTPEADKYDPGYFIAFGLSIVLFLVLSVLKSIISNFLVLNSGTSLYRQIAYRVMRARVLFFDENPSGKILTRFSKEFMILDNLLPLWLLVGFTGISRIVTVAVSVIIVNPYMVVAFAICTTYFVLLFRYVIVPLREAVRLESQNRGPLHQVLIQTISGITSIRAYKRLPYFRKMFQAELERSSNSSFTQLSISRWLSTWLDTGAVVFAGVTVLFAVLFKDKVEAALLSYTVVVLIDVLGYFSAYIRITVEIDNNMLSAQRVIEYTQIPIEDDLTKPIDSTLDNWPSTPTITFDNVYMRYRPQLAPSLSGLSFHVPSGLKVGIVGRTGAGKSSILQALFRLSPIEGRVLIDGVDVAQVGLHLLRKSIAFIPQVPFLMQGSIRENLDPFDQYSTEQIVDALKNVRLWDKVKHMSNGLYTQLKDSNSVFSVGEKQLICLARAILSQSKILVLDEATANVDLETDNLIQQKLRENFQECTLLIIAHRLATVIDTDRILVMSEGKCLQFDHPFRLLAEGEGDREVTKQGLFAEMVKATGKDTAQSLFAIAKDTYGKRKS